MMRTVKRLGLVLTTICVLSAVLASSASAASSLFLSHGTGKILGHSNFQEFALAGAHIECTGLNVTQGATTALSFLAILVTVQYTECNEGTAIIHPMKYLIDANGLVRLENTGVILIPAAACTITMPEIRNQSLTVVKFDNNPINKGLLLLWNLDEITSYGQGPGCEYFEVSKGTLKGTAHLTVDDGALKWDPGQIF